MTISLADVEIAAASLGSIELSAISLGSTIIWQPAPSGGGDVHRFTWRGYAFGTGRDTPGEFASYSSSNGNRVYMGGHCTDYDGNDIRTLLETMSAGLAVEFSDGTTTLTTTVLNYLGETSTAYWTIVDGFGTIGGANAWPDGTLVDITFGP